MAFTSTAALIGGAEVTAGLVLASVAEVGMAVTVVGAVTDNKDMMKVGGVMSLVGGIGGFALGGFEQAAAFGASNADIISGAVAEAGGGAGLYAGGAESLGAAVSAGGEWIGGEALASGLDFASGMGSMAGGIADIGTGVAEAGAGALDVAGTIGEAVSNAGGIANTGIIDAAQSSQSLMGAAGEALGNSGGIAKQVAGGTESIRGATDLSIAGGKAMDAGKQAAGGFWDGVKGVGQWMEQNKTLAGLMVNVGSKAVLGAMQSDQNEEMLEIQRRRVAVDEARQRNQSTTVAPSARYIPPQQPAQTRTGIINGVR